MTYSLSNYNFILPEHLIAQQLASPADSARMMVIDQGQTSHEHFTDIVDHLDSGDLLIFNDSKVVPARVQLTSADTITSKSGKIIDFKLGEAEIFFLRQYSDTTFEALVRRGKRFKTGSIVTIGDYQLTIGETTEAGRLINISPSGQGGVGGGLENHQNLVLQFLHDHGTIPLPPYIADDESKYDDYQPIVARQEGSVAAPTAALHFTDRLLDQLRAKGVIQASVTLHIGIGTFRLIDVDDVRDHEIHREWCQVSSSLWDTVADCHHAGRRVVVVGTTSCRIIESLPYLYLQVRDQLILSPTTRTYRDTVTTGLTDPGYIVDPLVSGDYVLFDTQLYMYPGFVPRILDHLMTNFHLPKSTLLLMIASLIGYDVLMRAYEIAIQQEYQFYSFGDGMLLKSLRN